MSGEKKDYKSLSKIPKHQGFFYNPATMKIVWRGTVEGRAVTVRTGVVAKINSRSGSIEGIGKAKEIVETEITAIKTGKSEAAVKRERLGITNPLLNDVFNELKAERLPGKEDGTSKNYNQAWSNGMAGFWGKCTCADLTSQNISLYKQWYLKEKGERLFDKTFDFFKMLLRFAMARKYIKEIPDFSVLNDLDEIIKKNKQYEKAGRVYTQAEERALLNAWTMLLGGKMGGTTPRNKVILAARARLAIILGLRCGMRASEIYRAEVSNWDSKKKIAKVWSFKNHKWRDIPLVPEVVEAVKYQLEANKHLNSKWLFPKPSDPKKHIVHQNLEKVWYRSREHAGIKVAGPFDARFHDLRKTFATMTAELGWPWKTACEILDMSGDVYEKTYANRIRLESKVELMNRAFTRTPDEES